MIKNRILILVSAAILIFVAFKVDGNPTNNICLERTYKLYLKNFMSGDGRIIDYERGGITTSEGQSYIMLRSLMMSDRKTFDLCWKWTRNNLERQDKLFAWLWGENESGEYKILDENSASDADVDIAFALLLAYEKWKDYDYLTHAVSIINSIWDNETRTIGEYLVLMPGVNQAKQQKVEINPSYFSPYAFKLFQKYDDLHDWNLVVDSSYCYLKKLSETTKTGLAPDWFFIENDKIVLEDSKRSDFSYDAIRVFLRTYLDYEKTKDKRALEILKTSQFFVDRWEKSRDFYTNYQKNGELRDKNVFIGARATIINAIVVYNPQKAKEMYNFDVESSISNEKYWNNKKDYYGKNLSWFAYYFYQEKNKNSKCDIKK